MEVKENYWDLYKSYQGLLISPDVPASHWNVVLSGHLVNGYYRRYSSMGSTRLSGGNQACYKRS